LGRKCAGKLKGKLLCESCFIGIYHIVLGNFNILLCTIVIYINFGARTTSFNLENPLFPSGYYRGRNDPEMSKKTRTHAVKQKEHKLFPSNLKVTNCHQTPADSQSCVYFLCKQLPVCI